MAGYSAVTSPRIKNKRFNAVACYLTFPHSNDIFLFCLLPHLNLFPEFLMQANLVPRSLTDEAKTFVNKRSG